MTDRLKTSWSAFPEDVAKRYLKSFGHPSEDSKRVLLDVMYAIAPKPFRVLDLGCGNGQLFEAIRERGLKCDYTGVDFSEVLLKAAREACPQATFISDDVHTLSRLTERFDMACFSHVIEMLPSPESALAAARRVADKIAIRFFEPPAEGADWVELLDMEVGGTEKVPYLRRRMSQAFYELILSRIGCRSVDIYHTNSKDQIHVLHFDS